MLRKHDIDLITGLVEGNLEDESEARALIAASEEARAEYEAQKNAFEFLRSAEPVAMTESERVALHRDVWTALRYDPQPTSRKIPWYYKLAPVAAALLLIVGLGAVLTQGVLNQESGNDAATGDTFAGMSDGLSADTTRDDSGEAADTTETMSADGDAGAADMADEEAAAPTALALEEAFSEIAEAVRTTGGDMSDAAAFRSLGAQEEVEEAAQCLERAGLPDYWILGEFEDPSGAETTYLVVVQSNDEIGAETQVVFIDTETCRIAHVEG